MAVTVEEDVCDGASVRWLAEVRYSRCINNNEAPSWWCDELGSGASYRANNDG
jgi:hypothetical protein